MTLMTSDLTHDQVDQIFMGNQSEERRVGVASGEVSPQVPFSTSPRNLESLQWGSLGPKHGI